MVKNKENLHSLDKIMNIRVQFFFLNFKGKISFKKYLFTCWLYTITAFNYIKKFFFSK